MARKPRPVDPTAGPLQEFAHDLRALREKAGSPTYRSLAHKAGFGATTLGEAAGGVRFPSLDVTLAYAGACGGDLDAWRERWQEVNALLSSPGEEDQGTDEAADPPPAPAAAADPGAPADPAGPVDPGDPADHADPAQIAPSAPIAPVSPTAPITPNVRLRWLRRSRLAQVALVCAVALIAGVAVVLSRGGDHPSPHAATANTANVDQVCPTFGKPGAFNGETYLGQTAVRTGPSTSARLVRNVPTGCWLQFTGYCLGAVVLDRNDVGQPLPDERWFELEGGDLMASAVIHGNPPATMRPNSCPGSVAGPQAISVGIVADPNLRDWAVLSAHGTGVRIAGYAAYYAPVDAPGTAPDWHEVGAPTTAPTADGFDVPWTFGKAGEAPDGAPVFVVATACLAGDAPTGVTNAIQVVPSDPRTAKPAALSAAMLAKAAEVACQIP
ncbi:MAG TPA: helix-turn-helix transcriptional regulator [Actinospica sp.]|nr:helix-turn-helix transcriptional regulator [Actinospica sp.]